MIKENKFKPGKYIKPSILADPEFGIGLIIGKDGESNIKDFERWIIFFPNGIEHHSKEAVFFWYNLKYMFEMVEEKDD